MPWRSNPLPYNVWVSEIMLQQTQVDTVIPYFNRFLETFPTVDILANADQEAILKLWEGLGYYSRARNLHKGAKLIVAEYNSELPSGYEALQKISGVGPYVAAAITSIAFNNPIPVVDGNVLRVFSRFWGIEDDIREIKSRNAIFDKLTPFIKTTNPSDFNQGIMELGALVCKPKNPQCHDCPLQKECIAKKENRTADLPVKSKAAPVPHYNIGVAVIWKNNKILIGKRQEDKMLGGLWEFPGGKQKENETIQETVIREVKEETDLDIKIDSQYCSLKHAYTHFKITLHAFKAHVVAGTEKAQSATEIKWATLEECNALPFPKANIKVFEAITKTIQNPSLI